MDAIGSLLRSYTPGHALPQDFYTSPELHARDMELLLARWSFAGHDSEIPRAGDWITAELGQESAIVIRQADGSVRAMANVCRHRGSRICVKERGHNNVLVCPYHAWSFRPDGSLLSAHEMPEGFDAAAHGLIHLPVRRIGGLIFISFGEAPPALDDAAAALGEMTARFGWQDARIAARRRYAVDANWKLVLENYHECYHCGPAHPEFSVLHALARPGARVIGAQDREEWGSRADGREVFRVMNSSMAEGAQTGSRTGISVAPLMGPDFDGGCVFGELGFLSAFLAYPDYGVIYRFLPRGVLRTEMDVIWLVRGDAVDGADYDADELTWLWDVTSQADKLIIERNQQGVLSRFYKPGPFSKMEPGTRQYVERYVAELAG